MSEITNRQLNIAFKNAKPLAATDDGKLLLAKSARTGRLTNDSYSNIGKATADGTKVVDSFIKQFTGMIAKHRFNNRLDLDLIVA